MSKELTNRFATAFISAQKEMESAKKDSSNPFFKSKYADINAVHEASLPSLHKYGIAPLQPIIQKDGKNYVRTILIHESGETMESIGIPPCDVEIIYSKQNDAQSQGSGITYARRYGLQSLVNIGAEDDDGEGTKAKIKTPQDVKKILGNIATEDMKESQAKAAEQYFAKMKKDIEDCGSLTELEGLIEKEKTKLNKLQKYHGNLYEMLADSIESVKHNLIEE